MEEKDELQVDAVAMVRRIRDAQQQVLESHSWDERVTFYRERAAALIAALPRRDAHDPR